MPYKSRESKLRHNRIYYKNWYAKNGRARSDNYLEAIYEWQAKHPDRMEARAVLREAIRRGKIIRPSICEECGRVTRLSGHHSDYTQPLEVIWLCSSCHKFKHPVNSREREEGI